MKRIICLFLVCLILVFSCVPVFGLTVDESYFNFTNISLYHSAFTSFSDSVYEYINTNITLDIYMIPYLSDTGYGGTYSFIFLCVPAGTNISFDDTGTPISDDFTNWTKTYITVPSTFSSKFYRRFGSSGNFSFSSISISSSTLYSINNVVFPSSNFLVFQNGKCVSEAFCSEQYYYVEDDYTEGNVVIEGLGNFFNMIKNYFKEQIDLIKDLPSNIITGIINGLKELFIPDIEIMKTSFQEFIDYMTSKFGFNDLIETLQGLVDSVAEDGSSVGAADVSETFVYNFGDETMSLKFSIPFSDFYTSNVKNTVGGFLKGIFFLLLIFYNLSEIYFLIRGTRPWKDPFIVSELNMIQEEKAVRHAIKRGR